MMTSLAYNLGLKNDNTFVFQKKHSLEKRKKAAEKINNDSQCFVVCEAHRLYQKQTGAVAEIPTLVVNKGDTVQNVLNVVLSKIGVQQGRTILLSCENQILRNQETIKDVYEKYNNKEDQILYIKYCPLDVFGCN